MKPEKKEKKKRRKKRYTESASRQKIMKIELDTGKSEKDVRGKREKGKGAIAENRAQPRGGQEEVTQNEGGRKRRAEELTKERQGGLRKDRISESRVGSENRGQV